MSRIKDFFSSVWKWLLPKINQFGALTHKRNFWRYAIPALVVIVAVGSYAYYQSAQQKKKSASAAQSELKTATVRRGNIVISASGTGQIVAAAQVNLGFQTSGTLTKLLVNVGDPVKAGQVVAQLDNTTQKTALDQAKQNLAQLTSPAAIASAQQAAVTAQVNLTNAYNELAFLISGQALHWEEKVAAAQQELANAQLDAKANPSPATQQEVQNAQHDLQYTQQELAGTQGWYTKVYVPDNFTTTTRTRSGSTTTITPPTPTDIANARAALALAEAQLVEAQDLVAALTGGKVPANATGSSLVALDQAQNAVQTAQTSYDETSLLSPISGVVTALTANVGDSVGTASILTISDLSKTFLNIYIDETDFSKLAIGEEVDVTFDALPNQTFTGHVTQIVPQLTTVDNVSAIQGQAVLDPNASDPQTLPVGLNATVQVINARADNVLLVPIQALKELEPGKYAVFVLQNGNLSLQTVEVGLMDQSYAEIKSGLQLGDVVSTGLAATIPNSAHNSSTTP